MGENIAVQTSAVVQTMAAVGYVVLAPLVGKACEGRKAWQLRTCVALGGVFLATAWWILATGASNPGLQAGALLVSGVGEAFILIPSYPLLNLVCPDRPGLVSAVFSGTWMLACAMTPLYLCVAAAERCRAKPETCSP